MWDVETEQGKEKTRFREIFEDMYKNQEIYKVNIFERQEEGVKDKYETSKKKAEFLNDVCDFGKGLKSENVCGEFKEYLYQQIRDMLQQENERCFNLLLENNIEFRNSVARMRKVMEKYSLGMRTDGSKDETPPIFGIGFLI